MSEPVCVVFKVRIAGKIVEAERFGASIAAVKASFRSRLQPGARILCAKLHTGEAYANQGRFC